MKTLVENIAVYAVEMLLVQELECFFSPSTVLEMRPEQIQKIAAESPDTI
jgi:hypothetical protein